MDIWIIGICWGIAQLMLVIHQLHRVSNLERDLIKFMSSNLKFQIDQLNPIDLLRFKTQILEDIPKTRIEKKLKAHTLKILNNALDNRKK